MSDLGHVWSRGWFHQRFCILCKVSYYNNVRTRFRVVCPDAHRFIARVG